MAKERIRLNLDLDSLLPGDAFQIGNDTIIIRPLGLLQYKMVVGKIKALMGVLTEAGVTSQNYRESDKLIIIAETLLTKFPEILSEVSNIDDEDLQQLPLEIIVSLIDKCLEVNLKAKDALLGNWNSLLGKMTGLLKEEEVTKGSQKSSKNS